MKNCIYKARYIMKNSIKKYPQIINTILSIMGVILTIAEFVHWMFASEVIYVCMRKYVGVLSIVILLISFWKNRVKMKYKYFIKGTDIKVTIEVSDVLNGEGAIVIPTNTTFDTIMEGDFISPTSVQWQFQKKYFDNNLGALDDLLKKGLEGVQYKVIDKSFGKKNSYPIGTVSKVTYNNKRFYFVAIADINEHGMPVGAKYENITTALNGVWSYIKEKGNIENIAIPLLGTGKAAVTEASREEVVKEIVYSFVAISREQKITEKLSVCIYELDLAKKDLNFQELDKYLEYTCEFR